MIDDKMKLRYTEDTMYTHARSRLDYENARRKILLYAVAELWPADNFRKLMH